MILGRNTQQWLGLITAAAGLVQTLVVALLPQVDPATLAIVLGSLVSFLGVAIAFIANTYTTPVGDPRLAIGTVVGVTNAEGKVVDTQTLTVQAPGPERRTTRNP